MITLFKILKYILKNNLLIHTPFFIIQGLLFQIISRTTNSIMSKKIFNDKNIFLFPRCNISSLFVYTDIPDKKEIKLIRSLIDEYTIFLDIGANIGSYSICVMDICKNIYAFEPHPFTANRCRLNFELNKLNTNRVIELALSDNKGKTKFSNFGESSAINHIMENNDSNSIEVDVNTLDNFIINNKLSKNDNYVIKIDTEGYEENVLRGAKEFLTNYNIKGLIFECFLKEKVFEILKEYKFKKIKKLSENNYFASKD